MWDRFITYLLSGLAWLFVGPTSDHFRCLTPDHEVMVACKHIPGELESRNVYVSVCVGVRLRQGISANISMQRVSERLCTFHYLLIHKSARRCAFAHALVLLSLNFVCVPASLSVNVCDLPPTQRSLISRM